MQQSQLIVKLGVREMERRCCRVAVNRVDDVSADSIEQFVARMVVQPPPPLIDDTDTESLSSFHTSYTDCANNNNDVIVTSASTSPHVTSDHDIVNSQHCRAVSNGSARYPPPAGCIDKTADMYVNLAQGGQTVDDDSLLATLPPPPAHLLEPTTVSEKQCCCVNSDSAVGLPTDMSAVQTSAPPHGANKRLSLRCCDASKSSLYRARADNVQPLQPTTNDVTGRTLMCRHNDVQPRPVSLQHQ